MRRMVLFIGSDMNTLIIGRSRFPMAPGCVFSISKEFLVLNSLLQFDEVQALMNGRRLSLRYPNMRCLRVEARSRSGNT
jgi:hypothetical protein